MTVLRLLASLLVLALCVQGAGPGLGQETPAPQAASGADAPAEAPPGTDPATEEAGEEAAPPAYPPQLDSVDIPLRELALRVIPLTVAQLQALADAWQQNVQALTTELVDAQVALLGTAESPAASRRDATAAPDATALQDRTIARNAAFERYTVVVDGLETKGGDEALVASYRAYRAAILLDETRAATWQDLAGDAVTWALSPEGGLRLAVQAAVILAALLALFTVARVIRGLARRWFGRVPNLSKLLQAFLAMVVYWIVIAIGLMIVLSALGVDITPLFAVVGGASFIIAFAMQETLGNLAAGLMIMINRPFDEGDYVSVAGTSGTVQSVSIVSTIVTTPDNQVIVIPNGKVWGDVITNVTASATRRVDLTFGIGYGDSMEVAQDVLTKVVMAHRLVLSEPAPMIRVNALSASSVDIVVRPWVRASDYWTVYWDLTRQAKEALDAAGITIPYPQTDMHLHMPPGAAALLGGAAAQAAREPAPEAAPEPKRENVGLVEGSPAEGIPEPDDQAEAERG